MSENRILLAGRGARPDNLDFRSGSSESAEWADAGTETATDGWSTDVNAAAIAAATRAVGGFVLPTEAAKSI